LDICRFLKDAINLELMNHGISPFLSQLHCHELFEDCAQ
jgi:hypothetical protein